MGKKKNFSPENEFNSFTHTQNFVRQVFESFLIEGSFYKSKSPSFSNWTSYLSPIFEFWLSLKDAWKAWNYFPRLILNLWFKTLKLSVPMKIKFLRCKNLIFDHILQEKIVFWLMNRKHVCWGANFEEKKIFELLIQRFLKNLPI